ncbi:MAG: hypothetical protein J5742_01125 [Alphaproteobacteria bacterium]|nr:hypothetical protein [Alphaproteobacteria bacterium]
MKRIKYIALITAVVAPCIALAATTKKQSAVQNGTTVRTKVAAKGVYSQECYDEYYGCMDQFCISENINGGSCACSNKSIQYEEELKEINSILAEADRIKTVEVEKVKLGANADIVFNGERKYDEKGNVIRVSSNSDRPNKTSKREDLLKMFETNFDDDDDDDDDVMNKRGAALFNAANATCSSQVDSSCAKDLKILTQMYQRQIESDCQGFANSIAQQKAAAQSAMNSAESDVRTALKESFDAANKYNQGECMVEFKKCMTGPDACGTDWINCVSTIASENMQNKAAKSTAGTKTKTTVAYDITPSVMERLESKRTICERVLDQCMAVRDTVWTAFLREAAPTLKLAELRAESDFRQSCLTEITKCIHTACKDDIAGKGVATMDSCLSRPDMARSFCKVQIDPCERMEPLIWGYVTDKLAAMRVDACTQEVKDCFMDDNRCGKDFMNCIGMDYEFIRNICPLDKLVVCKKNNKNFSMADIDSMISGLYLNIDNKALDNCQKIVEDKMTEVCGSTTDCNKFAADDIMGTSSLRSQKDKNIYRITGMISFGVLPIATSGEDVGKIDITDYMSKVRANAETQDVPNKDMVLENIETELKNVANNINRVIDLISSDTKIQYCVTGRNLAQIVGEKDARTTKARFPNLLNQIKIQIAMAALRKAQDNYQAKYNEYLVKATKDASADVAQYMCQMLPVTGGAPVGATGEEQTQLAPPYAISYEVSTGLNNTLLSQGGHGSSATGTSAKVDTTAGASKFAGVVDAFTGLAGQKVKSETGNGTREMWSIFNRDTRICHFCTSTVTKSCSTITKKGFLGIGSKAEASCTESDPVEKCEDIEM